MKSLNRFLIGAVLAPFFFSACSETDEKVVKSYSDYELNGVVIKDGYYKDARNNHEYRIMKIKKESSNDYSYYSSYDLQGYYLWFAENLDYVDSTLEDDSWCYEDNKDNCKKYGRLYNWKAAREACPEGWQLPTHDMWQELYNVVGDRIEPVGTKLKSVDQGTNRQGFYGLPAGRKNVEGGWLPVGKFAYFWSSTEISTDKDLAYGWQLTYETDVFNYGKYYKDHGMSVRCVKFMEDSDLHVEGDFDSTYLEEIPFHFGELKYQGQTYKTIELWGKTYMAENMNYETGNSWCYNNSADSCKKYGRLYDKETAAKVCPEGWRLMKNGILDDEDDYPEAFAEVVKSMGSSRALLGYTAEETKSTEGWAKQPGNNLSGFNLKPSGGYDIGSESFFDIGYTAYLWLDMSKESQETGDTVAVGLRYSESSFSVVDNGKNYAYAVRCMKE